MAAGAIATWTGPRNRVLVASADAGVRKRMLAAPECLGAERLEASGGAQVLAQLREGNCDTVWLDQNLDDLDAHEVASLIQREHPQVSISWIKEIAEDAAAQPFPEIAESSPQGYAVSRCPSEEHVSSSSLPGMIGSSAPMREVSRLVRMVAQRDTTVLITGETGTGKELVAEALHTLSPRARQPFVVVNCAAIPEPLLEAELFGYARGAFTGAIQSRLGKIQAAHGGTLFLDEIGELPLGMQSKLLRFLQGGELQRLGSVETQRVDVRVLCATNVNLTALVEARQFRMDLYYRLDVFPIALPALRARRQDIRELVHFFLERLAYRSRGPIKRIEDRALAALNSRPWPGNVRELQHSLERAFILSGDDACLRLEHFA